MCPVQWSEEETVVAIVLSMWGVRPDTIATLLTRKSASIRGFLSDSSGPTNYRRTSGAVWNRLQRYRDNHKDLWNPDLGEWNSTAVCQFFLRSDLDKDLIIQFLSWTDGDVEFMVKCAEIDHLRPIESYHELRETLQALGIDHLSDTLSVALGLETSHP
ncbi:hypothetical protein P170DRAFT_422065 [Aspergillus steynii IBT 23096]|uniref:Uncharacterized protein n=1 Tax=Aspergillus steynii IBT 23096 TaxID=1392250 RepID=A0A2I2GRM3_9EURO|nr:uncharacterized protein P170DRAFT_422065 [Aspergillus steynii IBT 23096]PLB55526.1 hypothetical protein P170DRAFT_422065 [Aspergillus steynii IBT 23096]